MVTPAAAAWGKAVIFWGLLLPIPRCRAQIMPTLTPAEACEDFASTGVLSAWTPEDCMRVWRAWAGVQMPGLDGGYYDREIFRATADELRRRGQPCVVQTQMDPDGAGSTGMRQLGAWLYAREVGCDWITPNLRDPRYNRRGSDETIYCHPTATLAELEEGAGTPKVETVRRCEYVSWLEYYRFGEPSVELPKDAVFKNVKVDSLNPAPLQQVVDEIHSLGWDSYSKNERIRLYMHPSMASRYAISTGGWDARKRALAREVLREMRGNFHEFPRPSYDGPPECHYDSRRLNIAVHIRMGDRRMYLDTDRSYFEYLDAFMEKVAGKVESRGYPTPLFHVFSQTIKACPSLTTRSFAEFPPWQIGVAEVKSCFEESLAAKPPPDCPERHAGFPLCRARRRDLFHVESRPIVLHLGVEVAHSLSCMIQADAVLMGCSTFGHIAGVLTKGMRLFSEACTGDVTPAQYRMVPPLAVADLGDMWVPVNGSWRDPVLDADAIFDSALTELLRRRAGGVVR